MKKLTALFVVVFAVAFSSNVFAQNTDTETANATASILRPLAIQNSSALAFGSVVNDADGGTVVISAAGARDFYNGLSNLVSNTTFSAASYTVTGNPNATYTLALPTTATIRIGTDGATMTVNNFTSTLAGEPGTLSNSGSQTISVGATLNVAADQANGDYTGTYDVTVAYN